MRGMIWFKKDLRLSDNPALYHACKQCDEGVIAVYIIDCQMWENHNVADCQIEFILRGLRELSMDLDKIGIPLIVENINQTKLIPDFLLKLAQQTKVDKLFLNNELEVNEKYRDVSVIKLFDKNEIGSQCFNDQLILPYEKILTKKGDYFKVFTAFKREWIKVFASENTVKAFPVPKVTKKISIPSSAVPEKIIGIASRIQPDLWPSGEKVAKKLLQKFITKKIFSYDKERDFPALDGTSQLSPYLALGMISARQCFLSALEMNNFELDSGNRGTLTWMSELIWREFYRHILIAVPRVCMNKAYKLETEKLAWNYNKDLLTAWQKGETGYPLVDAAMRQLNSTGWMHNRLRMVVAMFLSKNLFLDWRLGEKYFAEHLVDFDFASNNGGWQWCASTGVDAVPYFRIFNPMTQAKRFDPEGEFIRQYCPELKMCSNKEIHGLNFSDVKYTKPIVDYKKSRQRILSAFKSLR